MEPSISNTIERHVHQKISMLFYHSYVEFLTQIYFLHG